MESFKDRLEFLFGKEAGPTKISGLIGMKYAGFARVWYEGSIPKAETLVKIQEVTGCNLNWLLTGKGQPYLDDRQSELHEQPEPEEKVTDDLSYDVLGQPVDVSRFAFIPFYQDVHASAGYGFENTDETHNYCLAFRRDFLNQNISQGAADLSVITVKGNSMDGLLNHGDLILVNHARHIPADGLYVLKIGADLFVKLIQRLPNKKLLVKSTNPQYEPFEIDLAAEDSDITIIGKVEWLGRSVL